MVSVLDTQLFLNDVDFYLASPERYAKVITPKSSLLLSPGTTNNSSNLANEFRSESAFSFKENDDILSLSRSNSKETNELDLSFTENKPIQYNHPIIEINKLSEDALIQLIGFLDNAANIEMQSCEMYSPMEFQSLMPLEISPDEENCGLRLVFKENNKPEKMEKNLAKMRLLRGHQENFCDHFGKCKDLLNKCKESWSLLEKKQEDDEEKEDQEENEEIKVKEENEMSKRSRKCKKTKRNDKKKNNSSKSSCKENDNVFSAGKVAL